MPAGGTVVRLPDRLGDVVLSLPAFEALGPATVVVRRELAPLVGLVAPDVIPLPEGAAGFARTVRRLRAERPGTGVLLTPSLSSALLFSLGRVPVRRGTDTDGRRRLLTEPIPVDALDGLHRASAFWRIATGETPAAPPAPALPLPDDLRARWRERVGPFKGPTIGVMPACSAPARQWDPYRFATLAQRLAGQGARVLVFGTAAERDLTAAVAGGWATDLGGSTDLPELAAALADCDVVVCNASGPMHLAAAVGTRTLAVAGAADPERSGPLGTGHVVLQRTDLPCVPCGLAECPREGPGFVLPHAERECLRLIRVDAVAKRAESVAGLAAGRDAATGEGWDGELA